MIIADLFTLEGKIAIVTGGAGAIGKGIVSLFAEAGATVVIAERNIAAAEALADTLGGGVVAVAFDQGDPGSIAALVAGTVARFGRLDVMVNCAAAFSFQPLPSLTADDFDRVTSINLRGVALCCKEAICAMLPNGGGSIVNISSISGSRFVLYDSIAYAASKAGADGLTRTLAREYGERAIRVNAVIPGAIHHDAPDAAIDPSALRGPLMQPGFIPLARPGTPQDIAAACLYLASEAGRYVTGQCLAVDGGISVA